MYKVLHFHYHYMKDIILRSSITPLSSDLMSPFVEETLQRLHKPPPFPLLYTFLVLRVKYNVHGTM